MVFFCLILLIPAMAEEIDKAYSGIICLDISTAIRSEYMRITIGHPIGRHWSAGGYAGVNLSCFKRVPSDEETAHNEELNNRETVQADTGRFQVAAFIRFWPLSPYKGLFFSSGIRFDGAKRQDITAGIGYSMKIWKNIITEISYEIDILETYRNAATIGDKSGIKLGIIF